MNRFPSGYSAFPALDDFEPWPAPELDRLTHLVLVDGRLVDMWSEPVEGTRWMVHAERLDRDRSAIFAKIEPAKPPYDEVLEWLEMVVGGGRILQDLTDEPLSDDGCVLPVDELDIRARHRLESATALLERAAEQIGDPEIAIVLRRALRVVWEAEPQAVLGAKSAAHTAAGVCWAAGKANGVFSRQGTLTQTGLRRALNLPVSLSTPGPDVVRVLRGLLPAPVGRPPDAPDLLPLGRADLLTSSTRRLLVRLRERARAAKALREETRVLP